ELAQAEALGVDGGPPTGVDGEDQGRVIPAIAPTARTLAATRAVAVRRARRRWRVRRAASTPGGVILGSVSMRRSSNALRTRLGSDIAHPLAERVALAEALGQRGPGPVQPGFDGAL